MIIPLFAVSNGHLVFNGGNSLVQLLELALYLTVLIVFVVLLVKLVQFLLNQLGI